MITSGSRVKAIATWTFLVSILCANGGWDPAHTKPAEERLGTSLPGRMWVVNANVREQAPRDARDHSDMKRFVYMALLQTHQRAPDFVLLQQVNRSSTEWLKKNFSQRTGSRFKIAVAPRGPTRTISESRGTIHRDDSAILFNSSKTRLVDSGKFEVVQRAGTASRRPMHQVVPWATIIERGSDPDRLQMAAASIHFPKHSVFKNRLMSYSHKARWGVRVDRFLRHRIHGSGRLGGIPVLGGDFNGLKCVLGTSDYRENCRPTKLWKRMLKLRYKEGLDVAQWRDMGRKIIDYVFTRGNFIQANWDRAYHSDRGDDYYSDHGSMAVLVEDEDTAPPEPPFPPDWEMNPKGYPRLYDWEGGSRDTGGTTGWDGGSGLKHWLVYRRGPNQEQFKMIGRVPDRLHHEEHFVDGEVTLDDDDEYQYMIGAADRAGNISLSRTTTVD